MYLYTIVCYLVFRFGYLSIIYEILFLFTKINKLKRFASLEFTQLIIRMSNGNNNNVFDL